MRACSIPGCDSRVIARGWCASHYRRWERHGDPCAGRTTPGEPYRFLCEVAARTASEGCLAWPFARSASGYGNIFLDGRNHVVSRVVCEQVNGPPPSEEHEAAHSCGKGHEGCISPSHLRWALPVENQGDRYIHGTDGVGSNNATSKLSEGDVAAIRSQKGIVSQYELADQYGVTQSNISRIHRRISWLHVGA